MGVFRDPPSSRNQMILMPQSLDEMVGQEEPVRLLNEVMDRLDYSELERSYPGGGCPAYPPSVLVKILTFAYSVGQRSSRKIGEALRVDLRFIWLSEGLKPDFRTLARFRREKREHFEKLFVQSVRLCQELGLVVLWHVAVDGSKMESAAGRDSLWTAKRIEQERAAIREILDEAESVDAAEDVEFGESDGTTLPEELKGVQARKERVDEAESRLKECGKKMVSLSDPDSRQMHTRNGIRMSYNVQAAVDSESQVVLGVRVSQDETDRAHLGVMLDEVYENTGCKPDIVSADKGYYSYSALQGLEVRNQPGAIAVPKLPPGCEGPPDFGVANFDYDAVNDTYRCPGGRLLQFKSASQRAGSTYRVYVCVGCAGCVHRKECGSLKRDKRLNINVTHELRERMKRFLATKEGTEAIGLRKEVAEPVFGQVKENRRFRRFILRGLGGVVAETSLAFLAHNVLKAVAGVRFQAALIS